MRGIRTDPETERQAIELYCVRKLSLAKVARRLGISNWTVRRILIRSNEHCRSISEAGMKYPKTDFSANPVELARILGFIEDCGAGYVYRQIHVQSSTTHPSHLKRFDDLFAQCGHVSRTPGYNRQFSIYQWHSQVYLNSSFAFVIQYKEDPVRFLAETAEDGYEVIRIASLTDAEGWVGIDAQLQPVLSISNNNRQLLELTRGTIGGEIYRVNHGFQLKLRGKEAIQALRRLPIAHEEKVAAKELILHYADNGGIGLEALGDYRELRRKIDEEVKLCTLQARLEYIRRHGKPHKDDPDQTTPQNYPSLPLFSYSHPFSHCVS